MPATWESVLEAVNEHAKEQGVWGGAPLPIDGMKLVVEPRYPWQGLNGCGFNLPEEPEPGPSDFCLRNHWTDKLRGHVVYVCEENGKAFSLKEPLNWPEQRHKMEISVLGVASSPAWTIDAELRAMEKLRSHLNEHRWKQYVLCGMFLETSKRSGVTYLFRKLRPTLAIKAKGATMKILAALCLHPVGYYQGSYAGSHVPSDDVCAHLLMCRADEHYFWRKCNQHSPWNLEAGV